MVIGLSLHVRTAYFLAMLSLVYCVLVTSVWAQAPTDTISGTITTKTGSHIVSLGPKETDEYVP